MVDAKRSSLFRSAPPPTPENPRHTFAAWLSAVGGECNVKVSHGAHPPDAIAGVADLFLNFAWTARSGLDVTRATRCAAAWWRSYHTITV